MVKEMSKGGKLVWIAPSGGRDRPDPESGAWLPHRYDPGQLGSLCLRLSNVKLYNSEHGTCL